MNNRNLAELLVRRRQSRRHLRMVPNRALSGPAAEIVKRLITRSDDDYFASAPQLSQGAANLLMDFGRLTDDQEILRRIAAHRASGRH